MTVNILTAVELTADADHFWTPVLELLAMTLIENEHVPVFRSLSGLERCHPTKCYVQESLCSAP